MSHYEKPQVFSLGTVRELTATDPPDKCGGSGDALLPQQLTDKFGTPHCP